MSVSAPKIRSLLLSTLLGLLPASLTFGQIAQWNMEEGTGTTTADSSGNGRTLTFVGGTTAWDTIDVAPGGSTASIDVPAPGDFLQAIGWKGINGRTDRTVAAWIKTNDADGGIAAWGRNAGGRKFTFRTQNGNGPFDGVLRTEVNGGYAIASTPVNDGNWHHVALTFGRGGTGDANVRQVQMYVDGVREELSAVRPFNLNTDAGATGIDVRVGTNEGNNRLNGGIDNVAIYDSILSAAQIATLAGAAPPAPSDLYGAAVAADSPDFHWRLNESTTAAVANSTGTVTYGSTGIVSGSGNNGPNGTGPTPGAASLLTSSPADGAYRFDGAADGDGTIDRILIPRHNVINDGDTPARTIELLFNADSTSGKQVLIEEGGSGNGFGLFIEDGQLVAGAWEGGNGGIQNSWVKTDIEAGQTYAATLVFDAGTNSIAGFLDGKSFGALYTADPIPQHTDFNAIGTISGTTLFSDGTTGSENSNAFAGTIDEVAIYEGSLTAEQIQNHFGASGNALPTFSDYETAVAADNPVAFYPASNHNEATTNTSANGIGSAAEATLRGNSNNNIHNTDSTAASLVPTNTTPSIDFQGSDNSGMDIAGNAQINSGATNNKRTMELWFEADNTTDRQVLYEQGGSGAGYNVYIENGELIMRVWEDSRDWGNGGDGVEKIVRTPIDGNVHHAQIVIDGISGPNGTITGYLDGRPFGQVGGIGDFLAHNDPTGFGYMNSQTEFAGYNDQTGSGFRFDGRIDDPALYNTALSSESVAAHNQAGTGGSISAGQYGDRILEDAPIAYFDAGGINIASAAVGTSVNGIGSAIQGTPNIHALDGSQVGYHLDGRDGTVFDGLGIVALRNNAAVNNATSARSADLLFEVGSDITTRQVLWEEGGGTNGFNIYIEGGFINMGFWSGNATPTTLRAALEPNAEYHTAFVFDSDNDFFGGYLNGALFDSFTGAFGVLPTHVDASAFGGVTGSTRFSDDTTTGLNGFFGTIDNLALYDYALSGQQVYLHALAGAVPEPSRALLLLLGALGMVTRRRRA